MLERCVIPRYFTALPRERAHVHARADDRPIINHGPRCPCKDTREDGCKASCKHVPIVALPSRAYALALSLSLPLQTPRGIRVRACAPFLF